MVAENYHPHKLGNVEYNLLYHCSKKVKLVKLFIKRNLRKIERQNKKRVAFAKVCIYYKQPPNEQV